jgi:ATP/maltotriose-dependent transcriptional regulator MalT
MFEDSSGRFTARKKRRWGADYWYAFRRGSGRLCETYLGKARDITLGRLHEAVVKLNALTKRTAEARTASPTPTHPRQVGGTDQSASSSLVAKVSVPHVRLSQLVRTSAVDRLARMVDYPLTVVSAPAGYGKTTALAQAIAALRLPAAWVTLDERDNDPARFWAHISAGLERMISGGREAGHLHEAACSPRTADGVLAALTAALPVVSSPVLLVLDDYNMLSADNRRIHDTVALLAAHLPARAHLVLASKTVPPLPLAKLRTRHLVFEVGAADLALTLPEAHMLLSKRTGLDLTDEEIAVLHERTEGWVSALQLAVISLREQSDPAAWIAEFSGENRYIFDYLVEEVIKHIPPHMYDFALHVALLDRLCGPLCNAVTHSSAGQAMLEEMERSNLFLVPLDDRREWYRLHHLFADVLRRHLRQTQPRLVPRLYARASAWCETHGQALDAIDYAFEATELEEEHMAQLVEAYVPTALASGYFVLLRERLERLPDRVMRDRLRLGVAHAYVLFITGERRLWLQRVQEAEEAFARTEHLLDASEREIVRAEILALRTATRQLFGQDSPRESIAALRQAQTALPREHEFQAVIALYMGISQMLDGNLRMARQTFDALRQESESGGNYFSAAYTNLLLGNVLLVLGCLDDALALSNNMARRLEGYDDDDLQARVDVVRGMVLYDRNQIEQALEYLGHGSALRYNRGAYLLEIVPALAYSHLAVGNTTAAHQAIDVGFAEWAESQTEQRPLLVWTGRHLQAHQARLWLLEGNLEAASAWAHEVESAAETPSQGAAELPPYVREWEEIVLARLYLVEHRAGDTLTLLEGLSEAAQAAGRVARLLEILVLKAIAYDALGDPVAALQVLQQAVELGQSQHFVRPFVEGGPVIQHLLSQLLNEQMRHNRSVRPRTVAHLRRYVASLVNAMALDEHDVAVRRRQAAEKPSEMPTDESDAGQHAPRLTSRQVQIIRMIADGASNDEIARALVIAPSTAKRHVNNIYARLGVHRRTQAVARARSLGYLSPEERIGT